MKTLKIVAGLALLGLLGWFLASRQEQMRQSVTDRDSIAYWAAATLLVHHQDPYSSSAVLDLERTQWYDKEKPLVLRTPPWSLWMVLLLGLLDSYRAWIVWVAVLLASLVRGFVGVSGKAEPDAQVKTGYPCIRVPGYPAVVILKAKIPFSARIYFWSSLVWVSWYWYAQRFRWSPAT
jgi:hypothetical protein